MNKIWLSGLMISFVLFNPIKTLAQEKNCGWCGTSCIDFNERKGIMCTMISPPSNRKCTLISNRCVSTLISDIKVTPTVACKELYWLDNNSVKCETKKFCGMYMYQGLRTFETLSDCQDGINKPIASSSPKIGNVYWKTNWGFFNAQSFKIQVADGTQNGKIFNGIPSKICNSLTGEKICLNSNPPGNKYNGLDYMTLEATWYENDIEMRMFIYLYSDGKRWWSDEIRVYNGQPRPNSDWITFKGRFFDSPVGQAFVQNSEFKLSGPDSKYNNSPVTLKFSDFKINAFMNYNFTISQGDANGDGKVNLVDFSIWKTEYKNFAQQPLTSIPVTWKSDFNSDGLVDMTDFQLWKINYLTKFLKKN